MQCISKQPDNKFRTATQEKLQTVANTLIHNSTVDPAWNSVTLQNYLYDVYRVTIQVVPNLLLTSKQKFRFSTRPMY